MRRRLKTQGLRFFCGKANQADDLPNLLFGQRDPSSHVLIFSVLLGLTERFFLFLLYGQLCFFTFFQKIKHSQPPPRGFKYGYSKITARFKTCLVFPAQL